MEYFIMAYGRDFEPRAEIFGDSYTILEFYAISNVHVLAQCALDCTNTRKLLLLR